MTMTSAADQPNPPPRETITVDPARLAWGRWNHEKDRDEGEGEISASYSADVIATSGKIRRTFKHAGNQMRAVSMAGNGGIEQAEAYRVVQKALFTGTPTTYAAKTSIEGGDHARGDPNGFYDRMVVSFKGCAMVLCGPPIMFVAGRPEEKVAEPAQMELFA